MNDQIRFLKELPLLPDDELLELIKETQRVSSKAEDRAGRRGNRGPDQLARRIEAINRELEARGIVGQPWWAA